MGVAEENDGNIRHDIRKAVRDSKRVTCMPLPLHQPAQFESVHEQLNHMMFKVSDQAVEARLAY